MSSTVPSRQQILQKTNSQLSALGLPLITPDNEARVMAQFGGLHELNAELDLIRTNAGWESTIRVVLESASRPPRSTPRLVHGIRSQAGRLPPSAYAVVAPAQAPTSTSAQGAVSTSPQVPPLPTNSTATASPAQTAPRSFDQATVYSRNQAIQFESSLARHERHSVINLRGADAANGQDCRGGMDWSGALVVSLAPHEIGLLLAVLTGASQGCRMAGHGPAKDKWISVESSRGDCSGVRVTLGQGDRRLVAVVTYRDFLQVAGVVERTACQVLGCGPLPLDGKLARQTELYLAFKRARVGRQPSTAASVSNAADVAKAGSR